MRGKGLEMKEKIARIIGMVLELAPEQMKNIRGDEDLVELGLDSLNAIEVIVNLESEFNIQVEDEDLLLNNISTIEKLQKLVEKYLA